VQQSTQGKQESRKQHAALRKRDGNCGNVEEANEEAEKRKEASLICGTCGERLWLLRSRPDQVNHATMRRGPPAVIITDEARKVAAFLLL